MSNKRIIKLLSVISALGAGVQMSPNVLKAFDDAGAAPNVNSRQVSDVTVTDNGADNFEDVGKGTAVTDKNYGVTNDGRVIHVVDAEAKVAIIQKNGNKGQIDMVGDNSYATGAEAGNGQVKTVIDSVVLSKLLKQKKLKTADAIDLLGTETFVDKDLYLRTKEGKYLKTLTKNNGTWGDSATTEKDLASIRITGAVIKTMPVTNKFNIKCTYENYCLQNHKLFWKEENGAKYLVNDNNEYCNWEGKKVEDDKKEALNNFQNCLQIQDVPNEISFKFDQGQLATEKGWSEVTNRELTFVAVEVPIEVEKNGQKTKEKKKFLYSPSDKKYLGKNKDLKEKPDLEDEITDPNLQNWGINATAKKVRTMKHVAWTYNVHDKKWKMVAVYGTMIGTSLGALGLASWAGYKAINKDKDAGKQPKGVTNAANLVNRSTGKTNTPAAFG